MLSAQRHEQIKRMLMLSDAISLSSLPQALGVSRATAYRDVMALVEEGVLALNHGVITSAHAPGGRLFGAEARSLRGDDEIRRLGGIASAAAQSITENDSLFIGEGLVCFLLAQKIGRRERLKNLIVVTNNFLVAAALHSHVRHLYLIGGELLQNEDNIYTGGTRLLSNLSTIRVNTAFASVDGIDVHAGYTMRELSQLNILSQLPTFASRTIFLATSDRFGNRSIHQLAPLDFADVVITDDAISPEARAPYEAMGHPRLIVSKPESATP